MECPLLHISGFQELPDQTNNGNLNQSAYKIRENQEILSLENGDKVFKHVEAYSYNGSGRPDVYMGYTITEKPDGTRIADTFSYTNESSSTQEGWNVELSSLPDSDNIPNAMVDENHERIHRFADGLT